MTLPAETSMIERVAKAIAASDKMDWSKFSREGRDNYCRRARAALIALREPTEDMTFAGAHDNAGGIARRSDTENYNLAVSGARINEHNVGVAWKRMIDAALGEIK